jgi:hypothetical protein
MASAITLSFLLAVLFAGGCIDGTTPDCSSATSGCGPDLDGTVGTDAADATDVVSPVDAPPDNASLSDGATTDVATDGGRDAKDG